MAASHSQQELEPALTFPLEPLSSSSDHFSYPSDSVFVESASLQFRTLPYLKSAGDAKTENTLRRTEENGGDYLYHSSLKRSMSEGLRRRDNSLLSTSRGGNRKNETLKSRSPSTLTIPRRTDSKDPLNAKCYAELTSDDLHALHVAALKRLNTILKHYRLKVIPNDILKTLQHTVYGSPKKRWWKPWKKGENKFENAPSSILKSPMVRSVDFASVSRDTGANPVNARRLPIIVHECVKFIRTHGLKTTGIFRVNGSERRMAQLAVHFDSPPTYGLGSSFEGYTVYDVADFLKKYLRGVPEPLFTTELYPQFLKCLDVPAEGGTRIRAFRLLLLLLPPTHLVLLETLLELFGLIVQHSAANQMSAHSLARIFSPNVLRPKGQKQPLEEYERCSCVMELLIDHWDHFIVTPCTVRPFQMLDLTYASVREFLGISNLDGFPGIPQMSGQTLNENGFSTTPSIENEEAENSIGKGAVDSKRMVAVDTAPNIPLAKAVDSDCDSGIVSESGTVNITLVRRVRTAPTKRTRGVPENVTDPKQNAVLRNIPEDRSSVVVFPGRPPKKLRGIGSMTHLRRRTLATDPSSLFADPGDDSSNNQAQELEMLRRANEELTAHLEAVLSHI